MRIVCARATCVYEHQNILGERTVLQKIISLLLMLMLIIRCIRCNNILLRICNLVWICSVKWNDCAPYYYTVSVIYCKNHSGLHNAPRRAGSIGPPFPLPRHHPLWLWQLPNPLIRSLFKTCPVVTQYAVSPTL